MVPGGAQSQPESTDSRGAVLTPRLSTYQAVRDEQEEARRLTAWLRYIVVTCRGKAPDIARQGLHSKAWPHGYEDKPEPEPEPDDD